MSCGTRVDATWHARPRGSATQAHVAPMRRCDICIIDIYIWVIVHISLPIIGNTLTHIFDVPYNPDSFLLFYPCGTKFHRVLNAHDTWLKGKRRIKRSIHRHAWIAWTRCPPDLIKSTWLNSSVVMVVI